MLQLFASSNETQSVVQSVKLTRKIEYLIEHLIFSTFDASDQERSLLVEQFICKHKKKLKSLTVLDLRGFKGSNLCRGAAFILADILICCPKIEKIELRLDNIQIQDFGLLSSAFAKLSNLTSLTLECSFKYNSDDNDSDKLALSEFFNALPNKLTKLVITLDSCIILPLCDFLKNVKQLKMLTITGKIIIDNNDHNIVELLKAVASLRNLEELFLMYGCDLSKLSRDLVNQAIDDLSYGIQKMDNLKRLALDLNYLDDSNMDTLSEVFTPLSSVKLDYLFLSFGVYNRDIKPIIKSIFKRGAFLSKLRTLSFNVPATSLCDISYEDEARLITRFISFLYNLESLSVTFSNNTELCNAISKGIGNNSSLKSLSIERLDILVNNNSVELLFQNIIKHQNLESLKLSSSNRMPDDVLVHLSKALEYLPNLAEVSIENITISKSNIDNFVTVIKESDLYSLTINDIEFTDSSLASKLIDGISKLPNLVSLDLTSSKLCKTLLDVTALSRLSKLQCLTLRNNVGNYGVDALIRILPHLTKLECLILSDNDFTRQDRIRLLSIFADMPKLTYRIGDTQIGSLQEEQELKCHFKNNFTLHHFYNFSFANYENVSCMRSLQPINDGNIVISGLNENYYFYDDIDLDYRLAMRLHVGGHLDEALNHYYKILNAHYKRARIYVNIGDILLRFGRYQEALNIFEQGLQNTPNHNFLLFGKAASLYQLHRFSEALEIYTNPRIAIDSMLGYYMFFINKGVTHLQLQHYNKSFESLQSAKVIYESCPPIHMQYLSTHEGNVNAAIKLLHNIPDNKSDYVPLLLSETPYFPYEENIISSLFIDKEIVASLWKNNLLKKGRKLAIAVPYYAHQQNSDDISRCAGIIVEIIDVRWIGFIKDYKLHFYIKEYVFLNRVHKINENVHIAKVEEFSFKNIRVTKELKQKFNNLFKLWIFYGFVIDHRISINAYQYLHNSKHHFVEKVLLILQNINNVLCDKKNYKEFLSITINDTDSGASKNAKLMSLIDNLSTLVKEKTLSLNSYSKLSSVFHYDSSWDAKGYKPCILYFYKTSYESVTSINQQHTDRYNWSSIKEIACKSNELILLHQGGSDKSVMGVWGGSKAIFGIRCIIKNELIIPKNLVTIEKITVKNNKIYALPISYKFKINPSEKDKIVELYNEISAIFDDDPKETFKKFYTIFSYELYNEFLEATSQIEYIHSKATNLVVECDLSVETDASLLDVLKLAKDVLDEKLVGTKDIKADPESMLDAKEKNIEELESQLANCSNHQNNQDESDGAPSEQSPRVISSMVGRLECEISELDLPQHVHKYLMKELQYVTGNSDRESMTRYERIRNFLDLPWNKYDKEEEDLNKVKDALDKHHYGMNEIKEEILDYLANKDKTSTPILCLIGAPGVGKTSVAESIAKSIGRKCVKLHLGGMHDQSLIRGHHYTYLSATSGQPLSLVRQAGSWNPVMVLDEIDKISEGRGNVHSALLSLLDPANNHEFIDDYYDVPLDMSKIMYIATANDASQIPYVLKNRMHVIKLSGYTESEKIAIIQKYVLPSIMENYAKEGKSYKISDEIIKYLLRHYVQEAGVRDLKRKIQKLINRYYREEKLSNSDNSDKLEKLEFNIDCIHKTLGKEIYLYDKSDSPFAKGLVNGLSYSTMGGSLLPIEVVMLSGKGEIKTTGSLGNVLKESIQIAVTAVKRNLESIKLPKLPTDMGGSKNYPDKQDNENNIKNTSQKSLDKYDIHVNCVEGAVPKEGPSAGVALYAGIYSVFTGKRIRQDIAMTGEIGILGNVLAIGGLKEKICAAIRESIKIVIVPKKNDRDIDQLPDELKESIEIKTIENVSELHNFLFEDSIHNTRSKGVNLVKNYVVH